MSRCMSRLTHTQNIDVTHDNKINRELTLLVVDTIFSEPPSGIGSIMSISRIGTTTQINPDI